MNNNFRKLAERQIRIAFEQAQKEVDDLHQRTREGIETARLNGKQIGQRKGVKLNVKKAQLAKEMILKHSKDFDGNLKDIEVMKLAGVSRNSFHYYTTFTNLVSANMTHCCRVDSGIILTKRMGYTIKNGNRL